jgi:Uma2 family endonuclease
MAAPARKLLSDDSLNHEPDNIVLLSGVSWQVYTRLLKERGEQVAPRYAYDSGVLEIMSPSAAHEHLQSLIGDMIVAYCLDHNIARRHLGSWTRHNAKLRKGVEPDDCFVLHTELGSKTVPDLAIEVVWSRRAISKLPIYEALRVREVWVWENGAITVYVLRNKRYRAAKRSAVLPGVELSVLTACLDENDDNDNDAIQRFREHHKPRR